MFRNHQKSLAAVALIGAALLASCSVLGGGGTPTPFPDWAYTQAAQTIVAEITQNTPPLIPTAAPPTWTDIPLPTLTVPPSPTPEPSPTLTPSSTATSPPSATPNLGTLVYSDDFSEDSGWNTQTTDSWSMGYANGGYYIVVNITNAPIWSVRNQEFSDVRLEVDAVQTAGSDSGYFGLVCRHLSGEDYYAFAIGGDGFFGIGLVEDGEKLRWLQEGAAPAGLIQPAGAVNRIQADCIGSTLAIYANGQKLAEVRDETFSTGDTGLLTATRKDSGVAVLFSNYAIYVP